MGEKKTRGFTELHDWERGHLENVNAPEWLEGISNRNKELHNALVRLCKTSGSLIDRMAEYYQGVGTDEAWKTALIFGSEVMDVLCEIEQTTKLIQDRQEKLAMPRVSTLDEMLIELKRSRRFRFWYWFYALRWLILRR